jgi:hypothetical protein
MVNVLFPAQAVGMIVLPLMLFHQIQLMICATLARRYLSQRDVPGNVLGHPYPTTDQNVMKMNTAP